MRKQQKTGEIENRLLSLADVKEAAVIHMVHPSGDNYLCAYIVATDAENGPAGGMASRLKKHLAHALPDYMIPSHSSVEKGHRIALACLGISPLFDFDMRLGEGTGAAIGINIAEAAVKILNEMATFSSAGVSTKSE